jgi:hypothetical protein
MAITTRQTSLLVQQDWKTVYQTFREADFQSYDFETLRKTMIDYIRTYYPEDFNDFIESSEYIALIDLLAFLGQSLAFRTDINARENFIDTAERRDSILKLARLISYNPKRNVPSSGLLKIESLTTTESILDSNGLNLANLIISWNDTANDMWLEQFTAILDAALVNNQIIGKPGASKTLNGILTDEYTIQLTDGLTGVFRFTSVVDGAVMNFEAVSATSQGQDFIYERAPSESDNFNILYRNDNLGNASNNTGYFVYFKQGTVNAQNFTITESLPNRVVNFNFDNINNSDLWLYQLDSEGNETKLWSAVPAVAGVNVIYNNTDERNLYQISTRANDQIDLIFGDGSFTNIPLGSFRLYFRQSNGLTYKITPDEMQSIVIPLTYQSRTGRAETLTVRATLNYTVANSTARETIEEIRAKAPQSYYVQNRMITGEDYNLFPYTKFSTILKVKSVNRSSSGVSRYLDVLDVTGKYSSTNVFSQDGIIYKQDFVNSFPFQWNSTSEILGFIYDQIIPILSTKELQHFYYSKYPRYTIADYRWVSSNQNSTGSIGFFTTESSYNDAVSARSLGSFAIEDIAKPVVVGNSAGVRTNLKYITVGSIVKFSPGTGRYFDSKNQIKLGAPSLEGDKQFIYAGVMDINGSFVTLSVQLPDGAIISEIIPEFKNSLQNISLEGTPIITVMSDYIRTYKSFGLRYDRTTQTWILVDQQDLDTSEDPYDFSFDNSGNTNGLGLDSSWLVKVSWNGLDYKVSYRGLNYVFESVLETRFYFDERVRVYDTKTGLTINDQIKILKINNKPDSVDPLLEDQTWFVYKNIVESDGYQSTRRIFVTFPDSNSDGVPDNPDLFENTVAPTVNANQKYVYFKSAADANRFIFLQSVDATTIISDFPDRSAILREVNAYENTQIFYATTERKFYQLTVDANTRFLTELTDYTSYIGRENLYFQYRHNSPNYRRIDPSPNNIIDLYILTKTYAQDYQAWITDSSGVVEEPLRPSTEELKTEYGELENFKAISDTLIYSSAIFKPLFGRRAIEPLRAKFKVVKNSNVVVSDNDIKSGLIAAVNNYFDIANWDFGETFYFSELSAYLHTVLSPQIASVVIVPNDSAQRFGTLYQINAEANEILISAATVDDVEIISAITAAQLNQQLSNTIPAALGS